MSEQERIIKVKFNPAESELHDIFSHDQASTLWCLYRDSHIMSKNGVEFLNRICRDLIWNKYPFDIESARKFLSIFINNMNEIEYSRGNNMDKEWIENTIPFLLGTRKIKIVRVMD